MKKLFITGILGLAIFSTFAQDANKKNTTSMKIVIDDNGKKQIIEKIFSDDELAQKEIKKFSDSLDISMKQSDGKRKIVTVNVNKNRSEFSPSDSTKKSRRVIIHKEGEPGPQSEKDIMILRNDGRKGALVKRFGRLGEDKMKDKMEDSDEDIHVFVEKPQAFGQDPLPPRATMRLGERKIKDFEMPLKQQRQSKTIKGLIAHPNNPFNGKINVRFNAIQKGDVIIAVTDVNGKEIASESVKNFEGKYMGQIDLKKSGNGIYFVRVVQNGDGLVMRVEVE